jgi:hypothetical protein
VARCTACVSLRLLSEEVHFSKRCHASLTACCGFSHRRRLQQPRQRQQSLRSWSGGAHHDRATPGPPHWCACCATWMTPRDGAVRAKCCCQDFKSARLCCGLSCGVLCVSHVLETTAVSVLTTPPTVPATLLTMMQPVGLQWHCSRCPRLQGTEVVSTLALIFERGRPPCFTFVPTFAVTHFRACARRVRLTMSGVCTPRALNSPA